VFGVSASGELALAMGLRHPDIYGAVFCASPAGGYRPPALMPNSLPRAYLVAGTLEPFPSGAAGWKSAPTPTSSTHTREPTYLAGRLRALDSRLEDAHVGCSMQTKAWASDADQGIGQ
jgi:pimeloyl-ACP methyl ester carboxylesterase